MEHSCRRWRKELTPAMLPYAAFGLAALRIGVGASSPGSDTELSAERRALQPTPVPAACRPPFPAESDDGRAEVDEPSPPGHRTARAIASRVSDTRALLAVHWPAPTLIGVPLEYRGRVQ